MKKIILGLFLLTSSSAIIGCSSSSNNSGKDSVIDSSSMAVETPQEVKVDPMEALELFPGKKTLRVPDESTIMIGKWTMEVTNNSTMPIEGSAYAIQYLEDTEDCINGEFVDKTYTRTLPGVDVAPGETVTIDIIPTKNICIDIREPELIATED